MYCRYSTCCCVKPLEAKKRRSSKQTGDSISIINCRFCTVYRSHHRGGEAIERTWGEWVHFDIIFRLDHYTLSHAPRPICRILSSRAASAPNNGIIIGSDEPSPGGGGGWVFIIFLGVHCIIMTFWDNAVGRRSACHNGDGMGRYG